MVIDLNALAEQLVNLTVKQVSDLAHILETVYGIKPAAAAVVSAGPAAAADAPVVVEQTEFTVMLNSAGAAKLAVVKAAKSALGLGLKEAKELVDSAPAVLKEGISKEEAEKLKAELTEAGAEIEIK